VSRPDEYGPVRDDDEIRAHARNMAWSFQAEEDDLIRAFDRYGTENLRVWRKGGSPVAGLSLLPIGQWWGGRRLEMGGISLVGVAPEERGRGVATRLMNASVREMKEAGFPISVLYPAKQTLYRRSGWELAGARWEISCAAGDLTGGAREGTLREIGESDFPAVEDAYRRFARHHDGALERPGFMWKRITEPWKRAARGYLVEGPDGVDAYVWLYQSEADGHQYDLNLTDCVALTEPAARRLLGFLGDHASLAGTVRWWGDPRDPMLSLVAEQKYRSRIFFQWMLRIIDVKSSIEGRGYPEGVTASLHLEVRDDLIEENTGRFVVEVADGRARVREGGDGNLRTDVRGLATVWSGHLKASKAKVAGLVEGDDKALRAAEVIFGGFPASMSDMF
jgi:predicted acetyltransferase